MSELLSSLGIDWRLLIAQIINFGILVFLITRFLYKPILKVLDERRLRITENEQVTQTLEKKLEAIRETERATLDEARRSSDRILKEAHTAADQVKTTLLTEAHREVEKIIADGKKTIEGERKKLVADFKRELGVIVAASIEKTVGDVLDDVAEKKLNDRALSVAEATKLFN